MNLNVIKDSSYRCNIQKEYTYKKLKQRQEKIRVMQLQMQELEEVRNIFSPRVTKRSVRLSTPLFGLFWWYLFRILASKVESEYISFFFFLRYQLYGHLLWQLPETNSFLQFKKHTSQSHGQQEQCARRLQWDWQSEVFVHWRNSLTCPPYPQCAKC
jgi:hypothetical protein